MSPGRYFSLYKETAFYVHKIIDTEILEEYN